MTAILRFERRPKLLPYPFMCFGVLYNAAVIIVWCRWTLAFVARRVDVASIVPVLQWAYGAATGPLAYMTQKEGEARHPRAFVMLIGALSQFAVALQQEHVQKAVRQGVS